MTDLRADSMTGEQFVFDERTADPSSTQEGERWLRTDLTSGDKIATLRVDVGTSILDVPVFPVGTAEDSVVEAIRVRVGSQTGYIPAVPETNANFPALRLQHNGQVFGYHDEQGVFAFFDVAISSTNSPVNEGSDLNVDYSVVNTGFSLNNTQDIRLNIDSTEEDRDTNITLSPSSSTTGTLTWTTPSSSAGTYNASVLSDDDTASTSVTVEEVAIPDSVVNNTVHLYDARELSVSDGSTVDPRPDLVGSQDAAAVNSPTFDSDGFNSNPTVTYQSSDPDYHETSGANLSSSFTVVAVFNLSDASERKLIAGEGTFWNVGWSGSDWLLFSGSSGINGSTDSGVQLASFIVDGSNSAIRENGSETVSGSVDSYTPTRIDIGVDTEFDRRYWDGNIPLLRFIDGTIPETDLAEYEGLLMDQFNIS